MAINLTGVEQQKQRFPLWKGFGPLILNPGDFQMRAFLSHSSVDKPLATIIFRLLRDQAVSVWFDRMEMRPGDSLLKKIADGISNSDCLLVLVTDNSKQSPWVEKETTIALTKELHDTGPRVVPLLLRGCEIPTILADKIYITVDQDGSGIQDIVSAVFRDSYILDIVMNPDDLEVDYQNLQDDLYEFTRTRYETLRVRIDNRNLNRKVAEIIDKAILLPGLPAPVIDQIKRVSASFRIELPIYWVNLAELLRRIFSQIFNHYGKNLDAVNVAVKSGKRTLQFAHEVMTSHISGAVFAEHAKQFGYPEVAEYLRKYESFQFDYDEEKLIRHICEIADSVDLIEAGFEGLKDRKIVDETIFLPNRSHDDRLLLQMTCSPQNIITYPSWYFCCLPQLLRRFLGWTTFRDAKPLHEIEYTVGMSLEDYERVGLA